MYLFFAGAILFAGFSNAVLFFLRRSERASGYHAIVCIAFGINILLPNTSGLPLSNVLPWFDKTLSLRLDLITLAIAIGAAGMMIGVLFPRDVSGSFAIILARLSIGIVVIGSVLPKYILWKIYQYYVVIVVLFCAYCLYAAIRTIVKKRSGARIAAVGIFSISVTGGYDAGIIALSGIPISGSLFPAGLFLLALSLSYVIAKRFNESLVVAEALRKDLRQQIHHEQQLRAVQRQLSGMLDRVPLPVCAINENGEIAFTNEQARALLGGTPDSLRGMRFDTIIQPVEPSDAAFLAQIMTTNVLPVAGNRFCMDVMIVAKKGSLPQRRTIELLPFSSEEDELIIIVFHLVNHLEDGFNYRTVELFLEELNRNRLRIERLNLAVKGIASGSDGATDTIHRDLGAIDSALDQMSRTIKQPETDRRIVMKNIMTLSLAYWEVSTGQSRIEFARESGLWQVEVSPDGFERARTLDKYLDIHTLPSMPRLKKVLSTGDFVLSRCKGAPEMRRELEAAMSCLRIL